MREKQSKLIMYDEEGNPLEPKPLDFSSYYPSKQSQEDGKKQEYSEKAPISQDKVDHDFHEISYDLQVRYESPSFDKGGNINVTIIGKIPYTTGHFVQFHGLMESEGVGQIFSMSSDLLSSIKDVVYQEMPRIDKFSKNDLDDIYSDVVYQIAANVPFKSIYDILRTRYSKEFAKETKGESITSEEYMKLRFKQKQFYSNKTSALKKYIKNAQKNGFTKGDLVSIDFEKLKEKMPAAIGQLEKYNSNVEYDNTFVFLTKKDNLNSVIAIKTNSGKTIPIKIPTIVLIDHLNEDDYNEFGNADNLIAERDQKNNQSNESNKLYQKFILNKKFSPKEVAEAFALDIFNDLNNQQFVQSMAKNPSAKLFVDYYQSNVKNLTQDIVEKFIYGKLKYKMNLSTPEIDYALEHNIIDGDDVVHNPKVFLRYYEEKAQSPQQFKDLNKSFKSIIMRQKIKEGQPLNDVEKNDSMYFYILRQNKMQSNLEKEHTETQAQQIPEQG